MDFIIGMLKGKDIQGTLDELIPVASSFRFLTFSHPDAAMGEYLLENCKHSNKRVTVVENDTILLCKENGNKIIITGSLYLLATLNYKVKDQSGKVTLL